MISVTGGWRGAEVDNILRFEKDFPRRHYHQARAQLSLDLQYSGRRLHLIAHNEGRLGKTLQTDVGEKGDPVGVTSVWDSEEEARQVGEEIEHISALAKISIPWPFWSALHSRCAN